MLSCVIDVKRLSPRCGRTSQALRVTPHWHSVHILQRATHADWLPLIVSSPSRSSMHNFTVAMVTLPSFSTLHSPEDSVRHSLSGHGNVYLTVVLGQRSPQSPPSPCKTVV